MYTQNFTYEYAPGGTYGSEAYDLERLRREREAEEQRSEERRRAREREYVRTRTKAHTAARAKTQASAGVSVFSVLGIMLSVVLIGCVLMGYVTLASISQDTSVMKDRIMELTETQQQLTASYESTFNLTEIEQYATSKLGMSQLGSDQITYLSTNKSDSAVILTATADNGNVLSEARGFFEYLLSYFR